MGGGQRWRWAQPMQGLIGHLEGSGLYAQYDESSRDRKPWEARDTSLSLIVEWGKASLKR